METPELLQLNIEKVKTNLPNFTNEKICEMIVVDRYLGLGEKVSAICMEELVNRRLAGDVFDFETYIANAAKELPVLDFTIDVRSVLQKAMNGKFIK